MKKDEFIKILKEKLDILEKSEIDDIVEEYKGYIDEKIKNGVTEEEAIKDFGDIDELVTELLKAYKINVDKQKKEFSGFNSILDRFLLFIDQIVKIFEGKTGTDIIKIIIEIFVILLGIWICKIPFYFLEDLGYNVFNVFQNGFGDMLYGLWKFIIEFSYLIFGLVLFIKIIERRYLKEDIIPNIKTTQKNKTKQTLEEPITLEKEEYVSRKRGGFIDGLATLCVWFIKFIVICILLGIGGYIIGMAVAFGFSIYLIFQGVAYYGIFISIFVLLHLGIVFFQLLFNFVINRKNNLTYMILSIVFSFIALGISFSFTMIEITQTEFINEPVQGMEQKTESETIAMNDKYTLIGNIEEYIEDETLQNEIRIEFTYYKTVLSINPKVSINSNDKVYLNWDVNRFKWNKEINKRLIEDLKNKQFYNYSFDPIIKVYTSKDNITKLKLNKEKYSYNYYDNDYDSNTNFRFCSKELEFTGREHLSSYCKKILNYN